MHRRYHSWGRYPQFDQSAVRLNWRSLPLPLATNPDSTYLPFGNGRSYGDSCLNEEGVLLDARGLDRLISLDLEKGVLCCESGVLLAEILELIVPHGWFLPVVPGTKYVTVGGAIANDIHGKNHCREGTFGCHVKGFELLRSDGKRLLCSPSENSEWFQSTIGGLGLTGVILWAEITLKPIHNPAMEVETIRFSGLDEFFEYSSESAPNFEYIAAWIDCMARGEHLGRGLLVRGNHADFGAVEPKAPGRRINILLEPPVSFINRMSTRAFNSIHYRKQINARGLGIAHYESFFFPLDGIRHWNRLYGPRGFFQYQCVVPHTAGRTAVREIFDCTVRRGIESFFGVLKVFGDGPSPGLLSFPRPGAALALDFYNYGEKTLKLLDDLDNIVLSAGGDVNPYKDARMSPANFKQYFPRWKTLETFRDPMFSSSFWRRVTGE